MSAETASAAANRLAVALGECAEEFNAITRELAVTYGCVVEARLDEYPDMGSGPRPALSVRVLQKLPLVPEERVEATSTYATTIHLGRT